MKNNIRVCPVCGGRHIEKYWAMRGYHLARCLKCLFVWDPVPSENQAGLYTKSYFINENPKGGYSNYFEGMKINKKTFSERLERIEKRLGKKGRLLDVGCALGDCLGEAKTLGWKDIGGIEISDYAKSEAEKRGFRIIAKSIDDPKLKNNSYDVIMYQDVIEHLMDPLSELQKVRNILRKGGFIYLVTPDVGGWWSKILGSWWYHYKPGEHLGYFSDTSLKFALEKSGFNKVEVKKTYHVLSVEYVLNRLRYYYPDFFGLILKIISKTALAKLSFRAFTGEIEAWGYK